MIDSVPAPRIERWERLGREIGVDLYVARDDLLPFPLAGNKVRKLVAELEPVPTGTTIITNGAVDSNHCRTLAWLAAERGLQAHLVLHDEESQGVNAPGLAMIEALGATYSVVKPDLISETIGIVQQRLKHQGMSSHVVPGGCHSKRGAIAYRQAASEIFGSWNFDSVYLASGTGATHGGIAAAASQSLSASDIVGISVARGKERGIAPVLEAAAWAGSPGIEVNFLDNFNAGGYGKTTEQLLEVVSLGWKFGLPLDPTYTGKALWALKEHATEGRISDQRVLFWHTGGLWNYLQT